MKKIIFVLFFLGLKAQETFAPIPVQTERFKLWTGLPKDLKKDLIKEIYMFDDGKSLVQTILDFVPVRKDLVSKLSQLSKKPAKEIGTEIDELFAEIIKQKHKSNELDKALIDAFSVGLRDEIKGNLYVIKTLIDAGANKNVGNAFKQTPLHIAAARGLNSIADYLIKSGANLESKDETQYTPLHYAVSHKKADIVQTLINGGANVNAYAPHQTVLDMSPNRQISKMLIDAGAKTREQLMGK